MNLKQELIFYIWYLCKLISIIKLFAHMLAIAGQMAESNWLKVLREHVGTPGGNM